MKQLKLAGSRIGITALLVATVALSMLPTMSWGQEEIDGTWFAELEDNRQGES